MNFNGTTVVYLPLSSDIQRLRDAILKTNGNITRAASLLGVTKPYLMRVVKKQNLNEWARALRQKTGAASTGRPREQKGLK